MHRRIISALVLLLISLSSACAGSQTATGPATQPGRTQKLAHIDVDVKSKQIRVDCIMLGVNVPLEFFCVVTGTNVHESVLRTDAKPSDLHLALLMLGLQPGEPVHYSESTKTWLPPHGPPLSISAEFVKDGKTVRVPAARLMRSIHDKKSMPQHPFIFAGSRVAPDGTYAADVTGYVVSIVNFDLSMIDVPELASNANETLEWEIDKDAAPPAGTPVTMIIEPIEDRAAPATQSAALPASDFHEQPKLIEQEKEQVATLRQKWEQAVAPHRQQMLDAAKAHYQVISELRRQQQQLIDKADQIQRLIDDLEKQYQELTTPQPTDSNNSK